MYGFARPTKDGGGRVNVSLTHNNIGPTLELRKHIHDNNGSRGITVVSRMPLSGKMTATDSKGKLDVNSTVTSAARILRDVKSDLQKRRHERGEGIKDVLDA